MGATQCAQAQACAISHIDGSSVNVPPGAPPVNELLAGCSAELPDCFCEEDHDAGLTDRPLKEYTYALEENAAVFGVAALDQGGLSHRSDVSDLDRQAEFLDRKHQVLRQKEARSRRLQRDSPSPVVLPSPAKAGSSEAGSRRSSRESGSSLADACTPEQARKYKALGINVY